MMAAVGTFRYPIDIGPLTGGRFETVESLVDTGATYTWVPRGLLERFGIVPQERQPFILADGRRVEYDMAQERVRLDGRERFTVCIFGDEGTEPLLGVYTLEGFGLGVDPVNRRLIPVPGYLLVGR